MPPTAVDPAELPSVPDRPAALEPEPVRSYVENYEYAYKYREMAGYGQGIVEFNLEVNATAESVSPNAVLVAAGYAMDHGRWDDGDGTPHGYFDGHRYSFAYLVTDAAVWRATHRETGTPPDPREDGFLLECF